MKKYILLLSIALAVSCAKNRSPEQSGITVIRINQLGYLPQSIKVAVFGAKAETTVDSFTLHDAKTNKEVFASTDPEAKGAYGPFLSSFRLNFSTFSTPGSYYLKANGIKSPVFRINADVYDHTADFLLEYMRQKRCGYNPY
ncbi:MAG: cellulase N-terminal Ig-like domain-containing protein [Allomuricauda sp.]